MHRILITGATGNVGAALLRHLANNSERQVLCATRDRNPGAGERYFDFEDVEGTAKSLIGIDTLFLLRPPQLADVPRYFAPLIAAAKKAGVQHVVFLSVQGAERSSFIPHAKIEKLLVDSGLTWTFLRPSYFMQNLTTTLREGIAKRNEIFLPAGNAPFLWIDAEDIGLAAARILEAPEQHRNRAYTITGKQYHNFNEGAQLLSYTLGRAIYYRSPGPLRFYRTLRRQGASKEYIGMLLLLYFLPRFQRKPPVTNDLEALTGREPQILKAFIAAHRDAWI